MLTPYKSNIEDSVKLFGDRVKKLREERGISSSELAEKSGISRQYIWQLEDGSSSPSLTYAIRIANALGISVGELVGESQGSERVEVSHRLSSIGQTDPDIIGIFWDLLCKRAAAVQKVYQFDGNFSFNNIYQKSLEDIDWIFHRRDIDDECAMFAQKAIKLEARRVNDFEKTYRYESADNPIHVWTAAISKATEYKNKDALLPLYWSRGNALYAPNTYRYKDALKDFEAAIELIDDLKINKEDKAGFITTLAWASYYGGEYEKAKLHFQNAINEWLRISDELIKNNGLAGSYRGLGATYQRLMDLTESEKAFTEMLGFATKYSNLREGNNLQLIWGHFRIGSFYKFIGILSKAEEHLIKANELWLEYVLPDDNDRGLLSIRTMILNNLADMLIRRGNSRTDALKYLDESIEIGKKIPDKRAQAYSYWFLSLLYVNESDWDQALKYLDKSIKLFQEMTVRRYEYSILLTKVRVYCALNVIESAKELINTIEETKVEDKSIQILIQLTRAFVLDRQSKSKEACELYSKYIPLLDDLKYEQAIAKVDYANILYKFNNSNEAGKQISDAIKLCKLYGYNALEREAKNIFDRYK